MKRGREARVNEHTPVEPATRISAALRLAIKRLPVNANAKEEAIERVLGAAAIANVKIEEGGSCLTPERKTLVANRGGLERRLGGDLENLAEARALLDSGLLSAQLGDDLLLAGGQNRIEGASSRDFLP